MAETNKFLLCYDFISYPIIAINSGFEIVFWNKATTRESRISALQACGKPIFELYPKLDSNFFKERIQNVLKSGLNDTFNPQLSPNLFPFHNVSGKRSVQKVVVSRAKIKEEKFAIFSVLDVYESERKLSAYRELKKKTEEEIKKRKEVENELRKYLNQLESSNNDLDRFAEMISHDLRSPLSGVGILLKYLIDDNCSQLPSNSVKNIELALKSIETMQNMINATLEYSRFKSNDEVNLEQVNLNELIDEVKRAMNIPVNVGISSDIDEIPVEIDRGRMRQVLLNLISNAVKYNSKEHKYINIELENKGNLYQLSITDNGNGIDESEYQNIFSLYHSLNRRKDSYGIGLPIVERLVGQMGGSISVRSKIGVGSTFAISIPKYSPSAS